MKKPQITVLMSVYNGEKYLACAIKSILNQTYGNFEFLIIDDKSTDQSLRIIKSFLDRRIKVIKNRRNMGLSESLNKGIKLAQGKYIARMDADDLSLSNRLQTQFEFLNNHPQVTIVGSWIKTIPVKGKGIVWIYPTDFESIKALSLFNAGVCHPSIMIRKSNILKYKLFYDASFLNCEDFELWSRAMKKCQIANINQVLFNYRVLPIERRLKYKKIQQYFATLVRLRQLSLLLLNPTKEEIKIHTNIALMEPKNINFKKIHSWLQKIEVQNKKIKFVPANSLAKVLAQKWITLVLQSDEKIIDKIVLLVMARYKNFYPELIWEKLKSYGYEL